MEGYWPFTCTRLNPTKPQRPPPALGYLVDLLLRGLGEFLSQGCPQDSGHVAHPIAEERAGRGPSACRAAPGSATLPHPCYPSPRKQQAPSLGVMEEPTRGPGGCSIPQLPPLPCCKPRHPRRKPSSSEIITKLSFFLADTSTPVVKHSETEWQEEPAHRGIAGGAEAAVPTDIWISPC